MNYFLPNVKFIFGALSRNILFVCIILVWLSLFDIKLVC